MSDDEEPVEDAADEESVAAPAPRVAKITDGLTAGQRRRAKKEKHAAKFVQLLNDHKSILIIGVDNVGSNQMARVRMALRGKAIFLLGKNTHMRRTLRIQSEKNPSLQALIPHIVGNIGLVFTNEDLIEVRDCITSFLVPAAARTGALAPIDVIVPPGPTGMDPGQTSFFQALSIATKIMRGCIEIISEVKLITKGEKVTASHVSLLTKLGIKPFFYGITVNKVYEDGDVFGADVLDFSDDLLLGKFFNSVRKIAAISMEIEYPTHASIPHIFTLAFKKMVAIALETDYMFEQVEIYKDMIENPEKYGGGGGGGGGAADSGGADGGAAEEEKKEEEEEEEEDDGAGLGGGLFGDESGDGDY